jgi:hypothetical protein
MCAAYRNDPGRRPDGREVDVSKSDLVDIAMLRHAETDKAILVSETGERETAVWLPKSQIEIASDGHKNFVTITMPEQLAMDKGLI